jgi:hypothetical protein
MLKSQSLWIHFDWNLQRQACDPDLDQKIQRGIAAESGDLERDLRIHLFWGQAVSVNLLGKMINTSFYRYHKYTKYTISPYLSDYITIFI